MAKVRREICYKRQVELMMKFLKEDNVEFEFIGTEDETSEGTFIVDEQHWLNLNGAQNKASRIIEAEQLQLTEKRIQEVAEKAKNTNDYVIVVKFIRPLTEDLEKIASNPNFRNLTVESALRRQLLEELGEVIEDDKFEIIDGPHLSIENC